MKLSVSNIAWEAKDDKYIYQKMKDLGFSGLEIAPTRIIPEAPYDHIAEAETFAKSIKTDYGFSISSMQSIWYGIQDKIFGTEEERARLTAYTKKAIDFAEAIGCRNLVFGCPRNRAIREDTHQETVNPETTSSKPAISFFRELGDYAAKHHAVIAMEANPPIYHTNYINTTQDAIELIRTVNSEGFRLNLDVGTMIENSETVSTLHGAEHLINHVHISEPGLTRIKERTLHRELAAFLRSFSYQGFVSIETGKRNDKNNLHELFRTMEYVAETFA